MLTYTSLCRCGFAWPNITGLSPGVTRITCNGCSESAEYQVADVVDGHVVDAGGMSSTSDDVLIRALHAIRLNVMSERGDFGQGIERCNEEIERLLTPDGWRNEHHVRATYCGHGHTYCAGCEDTCPYCA